MNVGLGFNPAAFARTSNAPTQSQVNSQAAAGSGSAFARDSVVRTSNKQKSMRAIGLGIVGTKKVLDKAGVTKVAGARKR